MKTAPFYWTALMLAALLAAPGALAQRVIYVDTDAVGANDGSSWANAFVFLQDALAIATDGDEVWVAEGVYRPDQGMGIDQGDRGRTFEVRSGVSVFGGFRGFERSSSDRFEPLPRTVLSGDLNKNDSEFAVGSEPSRADNSMVVVWAHGSEKILLDGLAIESATASTTPPYPHRIAGAGLWADHSNISLRRLIVSGNFGHGIFIDGGSASADSLEISENWAETFGGGIYCSYAESFVLRKSELLGNVASSGGGIYADSCPARLTDLNFVSNRGQGLAIAHAPFYLIGAYFLGNSAYRGAGLFVESGTEGILANVVFSGNRAESDAGALRINERSNVYITNATFSQNEAPSGGTAISVGSAVVSLKNSILVSPSAPGDQIKITGSNSDVSVSSCICPGGIPPTVSDGGGNIDADPMLAAPLGHDGVAGTSDDQVWPLRSSPAIDAGDNEALPPDSLDLDGDGDASERLPIDIVHNPRRWDASLHTPGGKVDIGSYEVDVRGGSGLGSSSTVTASSQLVLYPNPTIADSIARISLGTTGTGTLLVADALGRVVLPASTVVGHPNSVTEVYIGTDTLAAGPYLVVVTIDESTATAVLVKFAGNQP